MRLVNHEFSAKLASAMFKSVVVPFGPDMYSLLQDVPISGTERGGGSISLLSGPFENYGDRIRKFGISFEVDEGTSDISIGSARLDHDSFLIADLPNFSVSQ